MTAGDDLNIICEASGNPVPRVSWRRYETGRSISGGGERVSLSNVTRSDAGLYVCTADNGVTQPVERITKILVRRKSPLLSIQLYLTYDLSFYSNWLLPLFKVPGTFSLILCTIL